MTGDFIVNILTVIVGILTIASAHYALSKNITSNNIDELHKWLVKILEKSVIHYISKSIAKKLSGCNASPFLALFLVAISIVYLLVTWVIVGLPDYNTSNRFVLLIVVGASMISAAYATGAFIGQLQKTGQKVNSELSDTADKPRTEVAKFLVYNVIIFVTVIIVFEGYCTGLFVAAIAVVVPIADEIVRHWKY